MEDQNRNTEQQPNAVHVFSVNAFAGKRSPITTSFAIVIILFFFTFCELKCSNGETVGRIKGTDFVTGKTLEGDTEKDDERIPANIWAIISLGAAIVGLGAFLIKEKREAKIGAVAGLIGFISLLVLQFDFKGKIKRDPESSVIADFQLAYWLAVITLAFAGILSYLRTQRIRQTPSAVPSSSAEAISETENISKSQLSLSQPQSRSFDISIWVKKNINLFVYSFVVAVLLFVGYHFFLRRDPVKDGKKLSAMRCNCEKEQIDETIKYYTNFLNEFGNYNFAGRDEARTESNMQLQALNDKRKSCDSIATVKFIELTKRYKKSTKKLTNLINTVNEQASINSTQAKCNKRFDELNNLADQFNNKIDLFVGIVEKEQARLDSIATATAQMEQIASLEYAEKNMPTVDHMKLGIMGKVMRGINDQRLSDQFSYWTFNKQEDILSFNFTTGTFDKNNHLYTGIIEMDLFDTNTREYFWCKAQITYLWHISRREWNIQNITSLEWVKKKKK